MTARCTRCGKYWGISIKKRIPKSGYICPHCTKKKFKKGEKSYEISD